jgi:hypothetical protein
MRIQPCPTDAPGVPAQSGGRRRSGNTTMKYSLRKTPSHLHLAYKYGEASDGLMGRHFVLETQERVLTLSIDLTPNFHTRNKAATAYLNAVNFPHNHHKLRYLQCSDNLVRARLIKAWEQVQHPKLRMCLELGARGHYLYTVQPHSLFMGGIQFDVEEVLKEQQPARLRAASPEFHGISHA